ncbi:MAG: succinylglutamate desuccinylase/aspartoacylase family protein [Firmicutes bacterium]|nr:succinylglutamate desuccinylase/aspartoacylase family protein [Bacillota bacterium]
MKRFPLAVGFLLAAVLLAGCGFFPANSTPPAQVDTGSVTFVVDLTELQRELITVGSAAAAMVKGDRVIEQDLVLSASEASGLVSDVPVGDWQATVRLYDELGDELAAVQRTVTVEKDSTVEVVLVAKFQDGRVTLEPPGMEPDPPGDGDPGDGEPGDGEPGDGEEPGDPGTEPEPPEVSRDVRYIQSGNRTETRTEVYIIRSSNPGPTAFLVGGVHGSETSGWIVAGEVAKTWDIDRGTLVVIPEANKDAVRRDRRTGRDGRDLNRHFPIASSLNSSSDWLLAREIWNVVLEFQPVALLDLHEGWGLREAGDRFPGGTLSVGQTIIVYDAGDAMDFAEHVVNVLNTEHNPFYGTAGLTYNFRIIGPPIKGSLARKAGADMGIPAFIFEPTQGRSGRHQTTVAQRAQWSRVVVEEFLRWYGLID